MPFGVSHDFLTLARAGQRRAFTTLGPLVGVALAGAFVAEMMDETRAGPFVILYVVAIAAGLGLGALLGWLETRSWAQSLGDGWQNWMHSSVGAGSMSEAAHRAGARRLRVPWTAAALLVGMNAALLIAAWSRLPPFGLGEPYAIFAVVTVLATGLAVGFQATLRIVEAWWCHEVEAQTLELVRTGRVGVWGVR